jgi:hypothetical protein
MARTIIGLFDSVDEARTVLQELMYQRLPSGSIGVIANRRNTFADSIISVTQAGMGGDASIALVIFLPGNMADLADALDEIGVSEEDTQIFLAGIDQGNLLAIIEVDYSMFDRAMGIINSRTRKMSWLRGRRFLPLFASPHGPGRGY